MDEIIRLVDASTRGDLGAYGTLVVRFQDMVYGYARSLLWDSHLAEDAAQESFLHAYQHLRDLRKPAAFPGWLRRIVLTQCDRLLRRKAPRPAGLDLARNLADRQGGPQDQAQQKELAEKVLAAIQALPDSQREVTTLFYVNGYSYTEVSAFLDVPTATVKSRLRAARRNLTKELIEMVKHTLHEEKPGPELPRQVIRRLMAEAKEAHSIRDYARLLNLCDEALKRMEEVRPSSVRQADTVRLHIWRGEAQAFGRRDARAATADYARALELAEVLGDADGQRRAVQALLVTCGSADDWKAMARWGSHGRELASAALESGPKEAEPLLGQCEAAIDLANRAAHRWRPGSAGGFTIGSAVIERRDGGLWVLDPRALRAKDPPDILLNLSQGVPAYVSILMFLRPVVNSLPKSLRVGAERQVRIEPISTRAHGAEEAGVKYVIVRTRCESAGESIKTPAGRFEKCWKLVTTMAVPNDVKPALWNHEYYVGMLSGTITSWIAPGVGLVRLMTSGDRAFKPECDATLTAFDISKGGQDPLPLSVGNRWTYRWTGELGIEFDEACRVIRAGDSRWRIAASADVTQASRDKPKAAKAGRSSSDKLRRRLDKGPPRKQPPIRYYEKLLAEAEAGPKSLVPLARFKLAAAMYGAGQTEQAEAKFRELLEEQSRDPNHQPAARPQAAAQRLGWLRWQSAADRRFDWALQAARCAADAWRATGFRDQIADARADVLLAEMLVDEEAPARIAGWVTAGVELPRRARAVETGGGGYGAGSLGDALRGRPWWMSLGLIGDKCLVLPPDPGRTWTTCGNYGGREGGVHPMTRFTIKSDDERVTVPAGRFGHCVRVCSEADLVPYTPAAKLDADLLGWVRGPRDDWYAPGVGLVRAEHHHANGRVTRLVLADFSVKGGQQGYFPARIGNQWSYDWIDEDGRGWGRTRLEVASRYRATGYLAGAGYWLGVAQE